MKDFVLINSPIYAESCKDNENYLPPLGLGYIATSLSQNYINTEILDSVKLRLSIEDIVNFVNEHKPRNIGINVFTQNIYFVKKILENINYECRIFIGGQVVKWIYKDILEWKIKNNLFIIIGEGEYIIPDLVNNSCIESPEKVINNKFVYRVNKFSKYYPHNISDINLERSFFKDELLINHYGQLETCIITSRGCPFNCYFCGGAKYLNKDISIRRRTQESIVNEMIEIFDNNYKIESVRILDDLFLCNKDSINKAVDIFSSFPNISWRGMAHVQSILSNSDLVEKIKNSNCKELFIGVESGSRRIRKLINKKNSYEDIIEVVKVLLNNGIDVKCYYILGFPEEEKKDFEDTFMLAREIWDISKDTLGKYRTSVFQFKPYHGTKLFDLALNNKPLSAPELNDCISLHEGRRQFNYTFGNFSKESDKLLNEYINKIQNLNTCND